MNQNRFTNITPVVKYLILINAAMLLLTMLLDRVGVNLVQYLGLFYFESEYFMPHQFVTHMFMHGGVMHLFFNMYALFLFGQTLEQVWGSQRFLFFYFFTGLGAAALHTFVNWIEIHQMQQAAEALFNTLTPDALNEYANDYLKDVIDPTRLDAFLSQWDTDVHNPYYLEQARSMVSGAITHCMDVPTVGASGAVFGVLLGFGMLFPNTVLMLLFPPVALKAKYFVIIYGAIELVLGFSQRGSSIAHFAHVGGMLFGYLLIVYWRRNAKTFY